MSTVTVSASAAHLALAFLTTSVHVFLLSMEPPLTLSWPANLPCLQRSSSRATLPSEAFSGWTLSLCLQLVSTCTVALSQQERAFCLCTPHRLVDISSLKLQTISFSFSFFWLHPQCVEVPRPGIKPASQQWQHQILMQTTPYSFLFQSSTEYSLQIHESKTWQGWLKGKKGLENEG